MVGESLTPRERLFNALYRKPTDRRAVASMTQIATLSLMEKSGSYWPEANREPDKMAKLAVCAYEEEGFENVRVPFGIHSEAEALGCKTNYFEGRHDKTPLVEPLSDLKRLKTDADPATSRSTRTVIEAVRLLRKDAPPDAPIVVGVNGPSSVTAKIHGMERYLKLLLRTPEEIGHTLDVVSEFIIKYIKELEEVGADVITLIDSSASGEIIGPELYKKVAAPREIRIIKTSRVPVVLHICGNCTSIIPFMVETGITGVSIDHKVDILKAKQLINGRASLIGNINPVDLWLKESKDIREITIKVIEEGMDIVAPGCGLVPQTPLSNIRTMTETVKDYAQGRA